MMIFLSCLLVFLAAFFKACADAFENTPNFNESIFKKWNKKFWCKDVSWQYAKRLFGYKFDSWHLSISAMICCFDAAIVIHFTGHRLLIFVLIGIVWNAAFVLFYHGIFKVK